MENLTQTFRDLVVWQRAMDLAPEVYKAIRNFPDFEKFALCDQLRRAVISVSANIAEGQGRHHSKEFAQFLGIARGSLSEVESLLILSNRLGYLTEPQLSELAEKIHAVRRPLHGLIEKIRTAEPTSERIRPVNRVPNRSSLSKSAIYPRN
jgi:four helix bundle protein